MPEMPTVMTVQALQAPAKVLRVLAIAAEDHGLTAAELTSGRRTPAIEEARRQATATLRRMDYNPVDILRFLRYDRQPRVQPTDTKFVRLPPRVRRIIERAARSHGVLLSSVLSPGRQRGVTRARQDASRELRRVGYSYHEIGRYLHVHHTTVIYHVHGRRGVRPWPGKPTTDTIGFVPDYSGEWAI